MATKISEEVTAYFTSDTTGLVDGTARATRAVREAKKEFEGRMNAVKGSLLNPVGAVSDGLQKFIGSIKLSSVTAGALSAGLSLAVDKFLEVREQAKAARLEVERYNEEYLANLNANRHTSPADDVSALTGRLDQQIKTTRELKQRDYDLNPKEHSFAIARLRAGYLAESTGNTVVATDRLNKDREKVKSQLYGSEQDELRLRKEIVEAYRIRNGLIVAGLTSSQHEARIQEINLARTRELKALEGSNANGPAVVKLINDGYDRQIKAVEEVAQSERERFNLSAKLLGIETSSLSDTGKRIAAAQAIKKLTGDELRTRQSISEEQRRSLTLENLSARSAIVRAQREQIAKPPAALARDMQEQRQRRATLGKLDSRLQQNDGLTNVTRDINGNVVSGTDIVTGEVRKPSADFQQRPQGLTTGGLGGGSTAAPGSVKTTVDLDPNGGLSLPGGMESSASRYLKGRPTVDDLLAAHRGDPAHDPAARLAMAPVFPDLAKAAKRRADGVYRVPTLRPDLLDKRAQNLDAGTRAANHHMAQMLKAGTSTNQLLGSILQALVEGLNPG